MSASLPPASKAASPSRKRKRDSISKVNGIVSSLPHAERTKLARKSSQLVDASSGPVSGPTSTDAWTSSEPVGGRLIAAEPLFSLDERHVIVATSTAVQVYDTRTSELARSFQVTSSGSNGERITDFTFSITRPKHLLVSTLHGFLHRWNWTDGTLLGKWKLDCALMGIENGTIDASGVEEEVFYSRDQKDHGWRLSVHKLMSGPDASSTGSKTILRLQQPITYFRVVKGTNHVVAASGHRLLVGTPVSASTPLPEVEFIWRDLRVPERITALDVQGLHQPTLPADEKSKAISNKTPESAIDVVIGDALGAIFVYDNLLERLISKERGDGGPGEFITPRRLHWHRDAVQCVRWSHDGHYLVSGGGETVLVIWQLDTGAQQYLPHLSASIESVVVSPSGSSYALRLSDNSFMVLSTTDLKPSAYVAGIQVARPSAAKHSSFMPWSRMPLVMSQVNPEQMLVVVPSGQASASRSDGPLGAPHLQTFDFRRGRHVARQALTRTNTTNLNISPGGHQVGEPTVTHIQISGDGAWLASVDEWTPPLRDGEHLAVNVTDHRGWQAQHRETYLKFWRWDGDSGEWALVFRVDQPHGSGRVLDLRAQPGDARFASVGQDDMIHFWSWRRPSRAGVEQRNRDGRASGGWDCDSSTELGQHAQSSFSGATDKLMKQNDLSALLAFSNDGTVLAASPPHRVGRQASPIIFMEPGRGAIVSTQLGLCLGPVLGLQFLGRHLVILSDHLLVWDVVDGIIRYSLSLRLHGLSSSVRSAFTHLAVDPADEVFILALPTPYNGQSRGRRASRAGKSSAVEESVSQLRTEISCFNPLNPAPVWSSTTQHAVMGLMHSDQANGFVLVDTEANVRMLQPRPTALLSSLTETDDLKADSITTPRPNDSSGAQENTLAASEDESDGDEEPTTPARAEIMHLGSMEDDDAGDVAVVRREELAAIFDSGPAYALPPIETLFDQVARLFSRKTH